MPKVSVIVPVYDVEKYLERCLNSLLNQTYDDYEVICINDCSPDQSQRIIDKFTKEYPSVIKNLKNSSNIGLGKTREKGICYAEGEYIMFVDSDDYVKHDYIQTYVSAIEAHPCDVVVGGFIRDINGKLLSNRVSDSIWSLITHAPVWGKIFRKTFIVENNLEFTNIKYGEDIYFSLSVFFWNATYYVVDYQGYYYTYNPESITGIMKNKKKSHEKYISEIFETFLTCYDINKLLDEQKRVIEYAYIADMVSSLVTFGYGIGPKLMRKKYLYIMDDLKTKFPDYKNNPYIGLFKPKGQIAKIRLGVGITMKLHKIHLDKLMFYIISLL